MKVIETRNLTKFYGKARGIEGLNLSVSEGDLFGFIGPNGAGKSTTIRILLGLISPTFGEALVLGRNVASEKELLLKKIGYLPSEAAFYQGMKVSEIIRYSAGLRRMDCSQEAKILCDRLGLDVTRRVEQLSLGNRKKVGIVCAFMHKPGLYIMDEPTSGLDPLVQKEFFEILQERRQEGATIFLSSHVLSEVQRYCSHAAIIQNGKIIACDKMEALAHTNARRVTVHGVSDVPHLEGMRDVHLGADSVSFLYQGEIRLLLSALAQLPIQDLTVTEPDLEEVFWHYYGEGERKA